MEQTVLPKDPLDREIIAMLAVSNILPLERQIWLSILPEMTEDEKRILQDDLAKAMDFRHKATETAAKNFFGHLREE